MNSLRSMSISRRLWLILVVAVLMLLTLGLLMLKQIHQDLYLAKAEKTRHVVQAASGVLDYYHRLETAGTLTRDAAQKQALSVVRGLRYDLRRDIDALMVEQRRTNRLLQTIIYGGIGFVLGLIVTQVMLRIRLW